jgi:hypothetical protein
MPDGHTQRYLLRANVLLLSPPFGGLALGQRHDLLRMVKKKREGEPTMDIICPAFAS